MASILVIDDDTDMRDMIAITLESVGYAVTQAVGGHDGIVAASAARFDIIILDLMMPDVNGVEVMFTLRQNNINTPLILITALREDSELYEAAARCVGAACLIAKPFKREQLLEVVGSIVETTRGAMS